MAISNSYYLYEKYERRGTQPWIPVYPNTWSINGDGTMPLVLKQQGDPECAEPIYRWVQTEDTICVEYVPPTPTFEGKYKLTLSDSSTVSAECDGTSAITSGEVSSQYSGTVVSAEIGSCVKTIGNGTFWGCYYLENIVIPNSVTSIGDNAFSHCVSLSNITIPDSVTNIGNYAFDTCGFTSITIGNSVTTIGYASFLTCRSATTLTIGNNVTSIGDYAFSDCEALTSITIPNSVITIGDNAFNTCLYATSLTIGSGVTSIGEGAFRNCGRLTSITVEAVVPPTLAYEYEFYDSNCPIYVPSGSVNAYKSATNWSTYASRIQAIP